MNLLKSKKGAVTGDNVVDLIVVIVILIGAAVPVIVNVIENQSFTGTNAIVAGIIPTFLLLAGIVLVAKMLKN